MKESSDFMEAARLRWRAAWCRQLAEGADSQQFTRKIEKLAQDFEWEAQLIEENYKLAVGSNG